MRINQFLAKATGLGRRTIDKAITDNRVKINGRPAVIGQIVGEGDSIQLDEKVIEQVQDSTTIAFDKPIGYVCSRNGQGSKTIYDLLPPEYKDLKPVGRLDKDSSGLILLTNDGYLSHSLSHPGFMKAKIYLVELNKPLTEPDRTQIRKGTVVLDRRPSQFDISYTNKGNTYSVKLYEGRNRQIRRTFEQLGYTVTSLRRTEFGSYKLSELESKRYKQLD